MINLIQNFYLDRNPKRQQEINLCLNKNLENYLIDRIILIIEERDIEHVHKLISVDHQEKVYLVVHPGRPSYNYFFGITHRYTDDINIISNSDIYFNQTLQQVVDYYSNPDHKNSCMALSRWDLQKDGSIKHYNSWDSQDAWIFNGIAQIIERATFSPGIPGCDNKIALLVEQAGYNVINPSKTIQSIHVHSSGVINYSPSRDRIPPPYKLINAASL